MQRAPPRPSGGSQTKRGAGGTGRGKADTGHKGSKSGKAGKKGMKRSASFAFGPADGEPGMRRRSVNVSAPFAVKIRPNVVSSMSLLRQGLGRFWPEPRP